MSRLSGMERSHLPDYSIGATVLVVAIALPFFVFTRAEHLHRAGAARAAVATPSVEVEAVIATPSPTPALSPSASPQALPSKAAALAAPTVKQSTPHPTSVPASPTSAPTSAPTATPTPGPDSPPVAALTLTVTSGPAPLIVTADASGSSDTDQTPIAQVIFNFGDGTPATAQAGRTATHTYASPGTYTLAVTVIDTAHLWSTTTATVTVN